MKREQNATASVCIGPKITPGGFAGDVVSASPTRSHPAVLFLLPVSLATPQLALAGEPGGRRLPAGAGGDPAASRAGGSTRRGGDVGAGPRWVPAAISSLSEFSMLHVILKVSHQLWHGVLDTLTDCAVFG